MLSKFSVLFGLAVKNVAVSHNMFFGVGAPLLWCTFVLFIASAPGKVPGFFHDSISMLFAAFILSGGLLYEQIKNNCAQAILLRPVPRSLFFAAQVAGGISVFNALFILPFAAHLTWGWWKGAPLTPLLLDFLKIWSFVQTFFILGVVLSIFFSIWINAAMAIAVLFISFMDTAARTEWGQWGKGALLFLRLPGFEEIAAPLSAIISFWLFLIMAGMALTHIRECRAN